MHPGVLNRQSELILVFDTNSAISRKFDKYNFVRGMLSYTWLISKEKKTSNHGAIFPDELVEKILLNFSNENDIIYDPFLGTGTTCFVAKKNKRRFIGSEISYEYYNLAFNKLNTISEGLFD